LDTICSELPFNTTAYASAPPATGKSSKYICCSPLTSVSEAHRLATILEERLPAELGMPAEVTTHLESLEDHAEVHREQHYTGKPE